MSEERKQYHKQYYLDNKEKKKQYYLDNKEKRKQYKKQYYLDNKEKRRQYSKKYYLDNKEKGNEILKQYRLNNKEKIKQYNKQYCLDNKEKINFYVREKIKRDPNYKLIKIMRTRILGVLKGRFKSKSTLKLLGGSVEEVWNHIESKFEPGMTKENHGLWHFDHHRPCASFDLTDPEQQAKCFHYTNLEPLWATDNLKKGARYEMETADI
jgi:hypothetical protein